VRTWLYGIGRNLTIDHARRMKHRRTRSLDAPLGEEDGPSLGETVAGPERDPSGLASDHELEARIEAAVEALPDELREVFLLRETAEVPFDEIAEIVGCPVGTAMSRMRPALEHLRKRLGDLRAAAGSVEGRRAV
jgi:RNA polymerase sigma-70 factor (ECF subfamily)